MTFAIIFTFITLIGASLALVVIIPLIVIMINHVRQKHDVVLLLMANTYIMMFAHCLLLVLVNANVLRADLYGPAITNINDSNGCHLQGFFLYVTFGWLYTSLVLQALYRFTRVLYAKRKIFQSFKFNLICIVIQWIIGFLIHLPVYLWPVPIFALYKTDYYCGIPYERTWGMFYVATNIFFNPILLLTIIYACLLFYIRHQSPQVLQTQQGKKAQRDFIITRRILFVVNVLTFPGLPNVIFFAMSGINPSISGYYYMYRIQWMGPAVVIFMLSIALVIMTQPLRKLIKIRLLHPENRIDPMRQTMTNHHTRHLPTATNRF